MHFSENSYFPFGILTLDFLKITEDAMDEHRCPNCKKLMMAMTDRTGRTELRCLKCNKLDPMKTEATKWAESPLAGPTNAA
jgi:hypothetical protein